MSSAGRFPDHRPRRMRRTQVVRSALADVRLCPEDLVLPLFVSDAESPAPVASMPGVCQLPVDHAVELIHRCTERGLRQFILFGVIHDRKKCPQGRAQLSEDAPVTRTLRGVRNAGIEAWLIADLCFCEYTDHGHCGALCNGHDPAIVDNDATLSLLGQAAAALGRSGADVVAPSGMIDGQVAAVRSALDQSSLQHVAILSYSIKYASSFYGPFRDAGGGAMQFGDRAGYQMDPRRSREWQIELDSDIQQGADMVMVKPAATYLDVVHRVRQACSLPLAAYHVSGEYAMLCAAAERGWLDLKNGVLETTYAIKRAGADLILTYFAQQLLDWIDS